MKIVDLSLTITPPELSDIVLFNNYPTIEELITASNEFKMIVTRVSCTEDLDKFKEYPKMINWLLNYRNYSWRIAFSC